jgi:hypothetical protein
VIFPLLASPPPIRSLAEMSLKASLDVIRRGLSTIDIYVGPVYRLLFAGTVLVGIISFISYTVLPYLTIVWNWIDSHLANIGPTLATPTPYTRLLLSLIAGFAAASALILARLTKLHENRVEIVRAISYCMSYHLAYYDELYTIWSNAETSDEEKSAAISSLSREHLVFLCSRISEIFEIITGCKCHTSIKTFNVETGLVTTRTRDALAYNADRVLADEHLASYPFQANTAFRLILSDPSCGMYLSNHLKLQSRIGRYENANNNWHKYYSATIVLPISKNRHSEEINQDSVIGFVCVDNNCGRLHSRYCDAILGIFVIVINNMLVKLGEMSAT